MSMHELLNFLVRVPLFAINFVSANMEVLVRKERGHLSDELVEKLVGALASRVHCWIEYAPFALDGIRSRRAGQIGITYEPRCTMPRHIEFRYDANTTIAGIGDDLPRLGLGIVQTIGAHFVQ